MQQAIRRIPTVLREEGLARLLGKSLRYAGDVIVRRYKWKKKKKVIQNYSDSPKYLNVGGGTFVKPDWRVLDYYSDHYDYDEIFVDYPINLENEQEWPIDDESFDLVYSSATLEHLSDEAVRNTLAESYRLLKPGGGIHITVPDVDIAIRHYEARNVEWMTDIEGLGTKLDYRRDCQEGYEPEYFLLRWIATHFTLKGFDTVDLQTVREDYEEMETDDFLNRYSGAIKDEWQNEHPGGHRNWFNYDRLETLLTQAGFDRVERTYARQSRFTELCKEGFDPRPEKSVHVEAIKKT